MTPTTIYYPYRTLLSMNAVWMFMLKPAFTCAWMLCVECEYVYYIPCTTYKQYECTGCYILDAKSIRSFLILLDLFTIEFRFRPRTCAPFTMHKHSIVFPFLLWSLRWEMIGIGWRQRMYFVGNFFWILPPMLPLLRNVIICNIEPCITHQIIHCVRLCDNCDKAKKKKNTMANRKETQPILNKIEYGRFLF